MTKCRLGTAAVLMIGAVLVLCGCGGGSKRLTKAQFAAKANALCAAYQVKVRSLGQPKTTVAKIAGIKTLLPYDRKLVADLKKLKPPANEEATVKRVLTLSNEQADRIEALLAAIEKRDLPQVRKLIAEGDANAKETKTIFRRLHTPECVKS
ncbi:MAG: hypothetical protein ABSC51_08585 [Gaiellaceae bacterium]